jgi:hypothetical protein
MRCSRFQRASMVAALSLALVSPTLALAEEAGGKPLAPPPSPAPLAPRSRAVAVSVEVLSPVGGAGCFYRRLYLPGTLVTAGSLIAGGSLFYALATGNREGTIINAVAYGVTRLIGIVAAARPQAPIPSATPPSPEPALPSPRAPSVGLSYALSF